MEMLLFPAGALAAWFLMKSKANSEGIKADGPPRQESHTDTAATRSDAPSPTTSHPVSTVEVGGAGAVGSLPGSVVTTSDVLGQVESESSTPPAISPSAPPTPPMSKQDVMEGWEEELRFSPSLMARAKLGSKVKASPRYQVSRALRDEGIRKGRVF